MSKNKSSNEKPLKIFLYVNGFLPSIGGRQFVVFYLAKALQDLGHKVCVVGPGSWWKNRNYKLPIPVYRSIYFGTGKLKRKYENIKLISKIYYKIRMRALESAVKKFGCDLIHAHNTYPNGYLAVKLSKKLKIPVVITPHGEDVQIIPELKFGLRLNPIYEPLINQTIKEASKITAISKNVFNALIDANASESKIRIIPNGVDTNRFNKTVDIDVRKLLNVPKNSKLIVTIGQYHPRKGHDILIRAMRDILNYDENSKLIIIGKSDSSLVRLIEELNLEKFVILLGQIKSTSFIEEVKNNKKEKDLLAAILQNSECYVSAGIEEDSEGLSLAVLEAMASSLPVVASNISGNRDIVVTGENGLLVTPGDAYSMSQAIINILSNNVLRHEMSINAKKTASAYDWNEIAKKYLYLYREVCK